MKIFFLPLTIFIIVIFFLWIGLHHDPRALPSPLLNKPAPALSQSKQDFQGHVTILNVFATWCVACQAEHSVWIEARHDLQNTQMVGLSYKDEHQKTAIWLSQYGNPYHQVIDDPQGNIGINWGVYGTPETFIIDKQGIIRYKFVGAVSPADWKKTLLPIVRQWEAHD